ncbi:hypothetical protein SAMN05518672_108131 [Chitinophaga sp. CF118]|nr:hypothetical protein SAMN05518672_108131 [Chitinophaga sp. CF118]
MLTEQKVIIIQQELRQRVIYDELPAIINVIACVDVEYAKETCIFSLFTRGRKR